MKETIYNLPNKPGVYKITSPTGKLYIGETSNLKTRGKSYLNPNKIKRQRAIYNSLVKYGIDSHRFEIIILCEVENLKEYERYYQEFYDTINNGLNCFYTKTKDKSRKHSLETKKIMSEKSSGDKNPFYGKKHNFDSIKKISDSSKGINNPNFGGKLINEDYLLKQSISNSKKPIVVIDIITKDKFNFINSKEAGKFLNCSDSKIRTAKLYGYKINKRFIVEDIK